MAPLLSVGIPTYNRSFLLEDFFLSLEEAVQDLGGKIEILVSDNASPDETEAVCRYHALRLRGKVDIQYRRNATNIGVSANLVGLLYSATGEFFTFIGDDDRMNREALSGIIAILEESPRPSAIVQSRWPSKPTRKGRSTFQSALEYFYEYGNPACGVVDRRAAVRALESRRLRSRVEELIWPQTVFGFLAMYDLEEDRRSPVLYDRVTAVQADAVRYTLGNAVYWRRVLTDLVWSARIVDDYAPGNRAQRAFISVRSASFRSLLGHLAISTLIEGRVSEGAAELRDSFLTSNRWLTQAAAVLVSTTSSPSIVMLVATAYFMVRKRTTPLKAHAHIRNIRLQSRVHASTTGVRTTNWF